MREPFVVPVHDIIGMAGDMIEPPVMCTPLSVPFCPTESRRGRVLTHRPPLSALRPPAFPARREQARPA